jgi:hypothetical protein
MRMCNWAGGTRMDRKCGDYLANIC